MSTQELASEQIKVSADQPLYARLYGLGWLHFLNDGAANYLPGILPAILLNLHLRVGLAGTIMAALLIGQALQALTGWFADRLGGRLFIVSGLIGTSMAGATIGFASNLWVLLPILVVIGISNSMFHPQALAGARALSRGRQAFGISLFLVGGEIGRGLWPLLASLVVTRWGLGYLWLLGVPALLSVPILWSTLPIQTPRHPNATPIRWGQHTRPLTALVGFSSLRALMTFGIITYLPVLWHEQGHSLVDSSALITILLVVGILGNIAGGHLSDHFGKKRVIVFSSIAATVLLSLFMDTEGFFQWVVLGLLGIALFATLPVTVVIGQDIFPENRSLGSGIALGVSNGIGAVALIMLGMLAGHSGLKNTLWSLVFFGCLASIFALMLPGKK